MALKVGGSSPLGHPMSVLNKCVLVCWCFSASSSMAEQRTLNPQVLGSSPRGRTSSEYLFQVGSLQQYIIRMWQSTKKRYDRESGNCG